MSNTKKLFSLAIITLVLSGFNGCDFNQILSYITPKAPLTERAVISFQGTDIPEQSTFAIFSNNDCIQNLQIQLVSVGETSATIIALGDSANIEEFIPRDMQETLILQQGKEKCIEAINTCSEQIFEYCFSLSETTPLELSSEIKEKAPN